MTKRMAKSQTKHLNPMGNNGQKALKWNMLYAIENAFSNVRNFQSIVH